MRKIEGFTIIEAIIVLFIFALISALAAPSLLSWQSNAKLRSAANNLKGDMELAKLKAIQENNTVAIHFTETGYQVFKDDGSGEHDAGETLYGGLILPAGVKIDLGETNFSGESARFKGRGTADPGSAVLVNTRGAKKKVTVSGLGKITISSDN